MSNRNLSEGSVHEAAHCVAALLHGIRILQASVDGEVTLQPPGDSLEQGRHHGALAAAYAVVALSGQAAAPNTGMSKSDQQLLEHSIFLGSWADDPDDMCCALSALAARFVIDHRDEIEKLAFVLAQRGTMSGTEIEELLEGLGNDG
ncbi:hypothetical protein E0H56_27775 [Rhizobium leguminosarum bv. viciae]|uniref:hypothetical protein n=1 Tax=Rhizobium leguminosarum TaxID=384 RepID=UPI00103CBDF3|nr:hypothetical protein [Rhizobium leguminosarum]TBZ86152.1 hypothetical protein E0H56_27775 [Rhizobium leguminosarum bv. viciae]